MNAKMAKQKNHQSFRNGEEFAQQIVSIHFTNSFFP